MSASSAFALISRRNSAAGCAAPAPARDTRAVRYGRWPVRRFSSPRNRPAPCATMTSSPVGVGAHDLDLALEHDLEVVRLVGRAEQHVADGDRDLLAVGRELGQLGRTERGGAVPGVGLVAHRVAGY